MGDQLSFWPSSSAADLGRVQEDIQVFTPQAGRIQRFKTNQTARTAMGMRYWSMGLRG